MNDKYKETGEEDVTKKDYHEMDIACNGTSSLAGLAV